MQADVVERYTTRAFHRFIEYFDIWYNILSLNAILLHNFVMHLLLGIKFLIILSGFIKSSAGFSVITVLKF